MRSCERRSFAALTIFMALVSCRVDWTDLMRRRMSRVFGMASGGRDRGPDLFLERLQELAHALLHAVVEGLLAPDLPEEVLAPQIDELVQLLLAAADLVDRDAVQRAGRAREDDEDLTLEAVGVVLALLEELDEPLAALELVEGRL